MRFYLPTFFFPPTKNGRNKKSEEMWFTAYLEDNSMEKNTYSPESTIPSSSAARRISRIVVVLAHITTTVIQTKEKDHKKN